MKFAMALVALLLFCALSFSVKEVDGASSHNAALAGKLISLENSCGFAEREPSGGDVFSVAAIKAVSLIPQTNNTTSDRAEPELLWSLAAAYPASATFSSQASQECSSHQNTLEVYSPSQLRFEDGKLEYEYGSSSQEVPLSLTGPNPVPLVLDSGKLRQSDFETLAANLSVRLSGKFILDYSYRRTSWRVVCRPAMNENGEVGGTYCGCESEASAGMTTYGKDLQDTRTFFVETGPVQEFWVSPPLEKRLEGAQKEQVILFARRMPAKISADADGKFLGEGEPYKYSVAYGKCGEQIVGSFFSPSGNNMALNAGNESVFPFQLVDRNASYLPFYAEFWWNSSAGRKEVLLSSEDRFGGEDNFSRNFSVRRPDAFSPDAQAGALSTRQGSDTQTPAAYPQPPKQEALPSFSPLAIIFALPFAFGAIAVARWLSRLHGK